MLGIGITQPQAFCESEVLSTLGGGLTDCGRGIDTRFGHDALTGLIHRGQFRVGRGDCLLGWRCE